MYKVVKECELEGVTLSPHENFGGEWISRPSVNAPGGVLVSYMLDTIANVVRDGAVMANPVTLDVTDLVLNGTIEVPGSSITR
ncbi:hypothetical protein [Mesorhizobium sp.]|uniref:hypothetical protein n=1 Tax=Mesorhizobium sp. TaxID=1871066 RepID=UPI000FE3F9E1|nr:hypothetical protein [Mesorhizobium sp.]RWQ16107.1 MAG: hypothetical protein EOR92_22805 [Mesorhizobium sp.]